MPTTVSIPPYLQARNLVSLTIAGGNPASDATITWSTPIDIAVAASSGPKSFRAFTLNNNPQRTDLTPSDLTIANEAVERDAPTATVMEIARADGSSTLASLAQQYDYFLVTARYRPRGASTGGTYVQFVGVRGGNDIGINSGENVHRLDLGPCGYAPYIGSSTPPY